MFAAVFAAVFAVNATDNETTINIARIIHCKYCPNRESPAISKWLELQGVANQAAVSKACFGFLFMVFF